jgi:DNA adenine methylase
MMMKTKAKPFLKWVGGKGQLLNQFEDYYPSELRRKKIKKYCEPFLGGGAVFFDVMQKFQLQSAYLSDVNQDLVLTYWVVQQKPEALIDLLEKYQFKYDKTPIEERNDFFLSIREAFNQQRYEINYTKWCDCWIQRAAQLIFLNKTCFNGLFRLNSKGGFNVPYGKYPKPAILDEPNLWAASEVLQKAEIKIAGYQECLHQVDNQTFAYFDPPYRPLNKTSSFTTYAGQEFGDGDQKELAQFFRKLDTEQDPKLMLSNSDPKNEDPNDNFFENIFTDYQFHRVSASRAINCNGDKRGAINEIVITNYVYEPQALAFHF